MYKKICHIFIGFAASLLLVNNVFAAPSEYTLDERILLLYPPPSHNKPDLEQESRTVVYEGIVEELADSGYRVVDKASSENSSIEIAATHDIDPYVNKAAAYGLKFFSEYTIFFRTTTIRKERDEGGGALVKTSAKIVNNSSSQIIASKSAESSSSGETVDDAIEKAGRAAGKKLGKALISAISKANISPENGAHVYTIVIQTTDSDLKMAALLSSMEKLPSVQSCRERESGGGKTTLEFVYKGKRDQLDRDLLHSASESGINIKKIRSEGNRSTWKLQP